MPDPSLASGHLLVAPPMMRDENFWRTVVLLCEHGESGSFGLVLNRPLELALGDVLNDLQNDSHPLSVGGPVQTNTLHYVHRCASRVPDAIPIVEDVYWGGDFETVRSLLDQDALPTSDFRFFLGYAGWSPGQLETEVERGDWIVAPATAALIFPEDPSELWRLALRALGGEYALLANFPDDPRLN